VVGGRPLWCAFGTQVGHHSTFEKVPLTEVALFIIRRSPR
jgi:hypothetical protein